MTRRRLVTAAVVAAALSAVWYFAGRQPLARREASTFVPLAMTSDGTTLAVYDRAEQSGPFTAADGPIHLLRTSDLTEVTQPIFLPTLSDTSGRPLHTILAAEFSPKDETLAVIQKRPHSAALVLIDGVKGRVGQVIDMPGNEEVFAFGRKLFSADGTLLIWHESIWREKRSVVRVWSRPENRELLAAEDVTAPELSRDGRWLLTLEMTGGALRVFDLQSANAVRVLPLPVNTESRAMELWPSLSADGRFVALPLFEKSGPNTRVFDCISGQEVYRDDSYRPFFLDDGQTLVTVASKPAPSVVFRSVGAWQVLAKVTLDLGSDSMTNQPILPFPIAVPGHSAVLVNDFARAPSPALLRIMRWMHLSTRLTGHGTTWVDALSGSTTWFQSNWDGTPSTLERTFSAGSPILANSQRAQWAVSEANGALAIWELPPPRSMLPLICVAGGLLVLSLLVFLIRRRHKRVSGAVARSA